MQEQRLPVGLLEVLLDLVDRPRLGLVGILVELAPSPALPKQVPHAVERGLGLGQAGVLLGCGDLPGRQLCAQTMFLVDEFLYTGLDLLILHSACLPG